jgi:hypothetical protein
LKCKTVTLGVRHELLLSQILTRNNFIAPTPNLGTFRQGLHAMMKCSAFMSLCCSAEVGQQLQETLCVNPGKNDTVESSIPPVCSPENVIE